MQLGAQHRDALRDILIWRRDVRHFRTDPVDHRVLESLRAAMALAPSVGNARPWRVMQVDDARKRAAIVADFEQANATAKAGYDSAAQADYAALKLSGMREAPIHLAIFTEPEPQEGRGLGRQTMPEMLEYSTVAAIHTLWLAARAENIGVGWVSILHPKTVKRVLNAPDDWILTAYLCLGYPQNTDDTPLLHQAKWQENKTTLWEIV